jgi:hypothetical protein
VRRWAVPGDDCLVAERASDQGQRSHLLRTSSNRLDPSPRDACFRMAEAESRSLARAQRDAWVSSDPSVSLLSTMARASPQRRERVGGASRSANGRYVTIVKLSEAGAERAPEEFVAVMTSV